MSAEPEKRPVGRPSEYDPAYCERVLPLGEQGMSEAEIAKALGVPRTTMRSWAAQHPEFSSALAHARDLSLAWWEEQGRRGINRGSEFNASLYGKCVTGRFPDEPYRDRVQVTGKNDGPIQTVDLTKLDDEQLAKLEAIVSAASGLGGDPGGEG